MFDDWTEPGVSEDADSPLGERADEALSPPWGMAGEHNRWTGQNQADGTSVMGILRSVASGVQYQGPPPADPRGPREAVIRPWIAVPGDFLEYFMPFETSVRPRYQTLEQFCDNLRRDSEAIAQNRARRRAQPEEETQFERDLSRLTAIVDRLLTIAGTLNRNGYGLGLVHPENILLVASPGGGDEIVLADWGFAFDKTRSPFGKPRWLVPDHPWAFLWDHAPEALNELHLARGDTGEVNRRTLARLFACCLVGREALRAHHDRQPAAPSGGSRIASLRGLSVPDAPVWRTIEGALRGKVPGDQFAKELRQGAMSRHFGAWIQKRVQEIENEGKKQRWRRLQKVLLGAAGLVVVGAGVGVYRFWDGLFPPPPPPHPLCLECPGGTYLRPGLDKFQRAYQVAQAGGVGSGRRELLAQLEALHRLRPEGREPTPAERACLAKLRGFVLEEVRHDTEALKERFRALSDDPRRERVRIDDLLKQADAVLRLDPASDQPGWYLDLKELRRWHCGS